MVLKLVRDLAAGAAVATFGCIAQAGVVTVDIYDGFTGSGDGTPFSGLVGSFTSPDVMFATNTGYNWHPFALSSFGAAISGTLDVAANGVYTFALDSDDGSSLFIDGVQVIDNGGGHGPFTVNGDAALTAGSHSFVVNFFEDFGGNSGVDLTLARGVSFGGGGVVPEPMPLLLAGLGLGALALSRRRERAAA